MTPLEFTAAAFGIAISAGLVGSLLGVGGGIIIVPGLTLLLGVDMHLAIGASMVRSTSAFGSTGGTLTSNHRLAYVASGMGSQMVAVRYRTSDL